MENFLTPSRETEGEEGVAEINVYPSISFSKNNKTKQPI